MALERHFAVCLLHIVGSGFCLESKNLIRVDAGRAIFFVHVVLAFALIVVYKVIVRRFLRRRLFSLSSCHVVVLCYGYESCVTTDGRRLRENATRP